MAKNDKIILDQIVEELIRERAEPLGDVFQDWALEQLLKDWDISADELTQGNVDGRNDGGLDGWFTFLDDELLTEAADIPLKRGPCRLRVEIFSVKHHDTFRQDPVVAMAATLRDVLDLSKTDSELADRYNESVLGCRAVFREALKRTARGPATVAFRIQYVSRGESASVDSTIAAHGHALCKTLEDLFSDCTAEFLFVGSAELVRASRRLRNFSSILTFTEGPIARGSSYVGLVNLHDYFRFVTDEQGRLRRYLFESNVRDYAGHTLVNAAIGRSLATAESGERDDFWWLNNGVTVIADKAQGIGKDLHIDNLQIVNGLQTTEAVFRHFHGSQSPAADDRCILVKVLLAPNKALADRIIFATNNQNKVDAASLRATDKVQRDIEDILLRSNWFYDRRKNYYSNHGKPPSRIVSMSYMSSAVLAVRLGLANEAGRSKPRHMLTDQKYRTVFSEDRDVETYLAALEFCKRVEETMLQLRITAEPYECRNYVTLYRFLYAHLLSTAHLGRTVYADRDVAELAKTSLDQDLVAGVHGRVLEARSEFFKRRPSGRRLHRSPDFQALTQQKVASWLSARSIPNDNKG
jgi:hypothetical protein